MSPWTEVLIGVCNLIAGWILGQFQISSWLAKLLFGPRLQWDVDPKRGSEVRVQLLDATGQATGEVE